MNSARAGRGRGTARGTQLRTSAWEGPNDAGAGAGVPKRFEGAKQREVGVRDCDLSSLEIKRAAAEDVPRIKVACRVGTASLIVPPFAIAHRPGAGSR